MPASRWLSRRRELSRSAAGQRWPGDVTRSDRENSRRGAHRGRIERSEAEELAQLLTAQLPQLLSRPARSSSTRSAPVVTSTMKVSEVVPKRSS